MGQLWSLGIEIVIFSLGKHVNWLSSDNMDSIIISFGRSLM